MGAVQFIEHMDRTTLTITDEEFEKNVEAAVSSIAEKHLAESPRRAQQQTWNEKGSLEPGQGAPQQSHDGYDGASPRHSTDGEPSNESQAISGLLKSFQKPLSTIGRIFSDEPGQSSSPGPAARSPRPSGEEVRDNLQRPPSRHTLSVEEAAARQASAEAAEAQRLHRAEHANVVETLAGMFPDLDKEIISDVVYQKEGRLVAAPVPVTTMLFLLTETELGWPLMRALHYLRSVHSEVKNTIPSSPLSLLPLTSLILDRFAELILIQLFQGPLV